MNAQCVKLGMMKSDDLNKKLNPEHWLSVHGDYLYRYALCQLREPAQAEDMVQETLLAALKAQQGYSGRSSEKTWLIGIMKHKIIDVIRKQVRESTVDDIDHLSDSTSQENEDSLFDARGHWVCSPTDWGRPEAAFENQQFLNMFQRCMEKLKPALAQIFTLKELTGQTTEEICNETGITPTNCNVMLYRSRMSLRRCLELNGLDVNEAG